MIGETVELKIITSEQKRVEMYVVGADHTLMNLLVKQLQSQKEVAAVAYTIEHPLSGSPRLLIETKGSVNPVKALATAISDLKKTNQEFVSAFSKLVK